MGVTAQVYEQERLLLTEVTGTSQSSSAYVDLGYSQYQGTVLSSGINQYLGIRYAAPPLGR